MKKNPFLAVLIFTGVFVCGGVVGGAVSVHYYERFVRNKGADRFFDREMRDVGQRLELTAQQKKEVRTIFGRAMADQRATRKQGEVIVERMIADFEAVLTREQRVKFEEHRAKQRAVREEQLRERERRGSGRGGPEGGRPSLFFFERRSGGERERVPAPPDDPAQPATRTAPSDEKHEESPPSS
jgi:hypothetical protein